MHRKKQGTQIKVYRVASYCAHCFCSPCLDSLCQGFPVDRGRCVQHQTQHGPNPKRAASRHSGSVWACNGTVAHQQCLIILLHPNGSLHCRPALPLSQVVWHKIWPLPFSCCMCGVGSVAACVAQLRNWAPMGSSSRIATVLHELEINLVWPTGATSDGTVWFLMHEYCWHARYSPCRSR